MMKAQVKKNTYSRIEVADLDLTVQLLSDFYSSELIEDTDSVELFKQALNRTTRGLFDNYADLVSFCEAWNDSALKSANWPDLEESIYEPWTTSKDHPLRGVKGLAWGDSARHMKTILNSCGLEAEGVAPDHLNFILQYLGALIFQSRLDEAKAFCSDHMNWIGALRKSAQEQKSDPFFIRMIDALNMVVEEINS